MYNIPKVKVRVKVKSNLVTLKVPIVGNLSNDDNLNILNNTSSKTDSIYDKSYMLMLLLVFTSTIAPR